MASGGDPENYDWLLDDEHSINELTKFDVLNVGHDFAAIRRLQNEGSARVPHDESVKNFGNRKNQGPPAFPSKVANVFRNVLYPDSGPRGVAPVDGEGPPKPSSSGRGQRNKKIQERKAQARAAENKVSSLSLIERDLEQTKAARQKQIFGSMKSKANPDVNANKKYLPEASNGKAPTSSDSVKPVPCPSLQNIADSLLAGPKRKPEGNV